MGMGLGSAAVDIDYDGDELSAYSPPPPQQALPDAHTSLDCPTTQLDKHAHLYRWWLDGSSVAAHHCLLLSLSSPTLNVRPVVVFGGGRAVESSQDWGLEKQRGELATTAMMREG